MSRDTFYFTPEQETTVEEVVLLPGINYEIAWGEDHACGLFLQIFDPDEPDEVLLDLDTMFTGLTLQKLADLIETLGQGHVSRMLRKNAP